MASVSFLIVFASLPLVFLTFYPFMKRRDSRLPKNWPILGMIPTVFSHIHRIHDRVTEILEEAACNFFFKGIWFANMDIFLTSDPANIHHILSTNFHRYPKGPDFKYIFDILGDGIFNSDSDLWRNQRRIGHSLVHSPQFLQFVVKTTQKKVKEGLIPILESVCKNGSAIDLQDLFQRFAFDSTCITVTGSDLNSLSPQLPEVPFSKVMDDVEEVAFLRHLIPKILWKLQKKMGFGTAKRLSKAWRTIDQTIAKLIAFKRENLQEEDLDLLASYMNYKYNDKFLRDTVLNFMVAGRDTLSSALSWFFFCLSNNPIAETKIREELNQLRVFSIEELNKLVYLHGALCETLRLYPPVPFQHKVPTQDDVLPSGHHVNPNTKIVFSLYALGRMASVWGEDCMEFKPERWITEKGTIKHVPSYKFLAFNAGPRTCLGKDVAFIEMKTVAAALIHNYNIQRIEDHNVSPSASIILHMKHGFKVKVTSRSCSSFQG